MNLADARALALVLIQRDLDAQEGLHTLDAASPDGDPGKFMLTGRPARVVFQRDGFYLNVNLGWFEGADDLPRISGGPFFWYVFVLSAPDPRYFVCSARRMRKWAVEFSAPRGRDFHDSLRWRSDVHRIVGCPDAAVFRWGDETREFAASRPDRILDLDNVVAALDEELGPRVHGGRTEGGESQAHLLLKQYIARHPTLIGVPADATSHIEYEFATGDRVDVMFENHRPYRSVVEVEVDGEEHLLIGVAQALKYQTLAGVEVHYPIVSERVRAHVVAYETRYPRVEALARQYNVNLLTVRPEIVLAS